MTTGKAMWFQYNEQLYHYYNEGAFGAVFHCLEKGTIIKLFLAWTEYVIAKETFNNEVSAYKIIRNSEFSQFAPNFLGTLSEHVKVHNMPLGYPGFYCAMGYEIEFLRGDFVKPRSDLCFSNLAVLRSGLARIGISHTSDSSVIGSNGVVEKIIDFSTSKG